MEILYWTDQPFVALCTCNAVRQTSALSGAQCHCLVDQVPLNQDDCFQTCTIIPETLTASRQPYWNAPISNAQPDRRLLCPPKWNSQCEWYSPFSQWEMDRFSSILFPFLLWVESFYLWFFLFSIWSHRGRRFCALSSVLSLLGSVHRCESLQPWAL